MSGKPSKGLHGALASLGVVALVAGCGGGAVVSNGNAPAKYIPPGPGSGTTGQLVKAQLLVQIPARGSVPKSRRKPKYYSAATRILTLAYAASPGPLPSPSVFSVPTPGATPTSFPITVQVPVGVDTFQVNTYDGATGFGAPPNGYLLSTAQVNQTINPNGAQNILITGLGVPNGVVWSPPPNFAPLENSAVDQTVSENLTVVDADGDTITGTLAAPVSVVPTFGPTAALVVSPGVISSVPTPPASASIPVTLTYKAGNSLPVSAFPTYTGPPSGALGSFSTVNVNPTFYIWVANSGNNTVSILDRNGANIPGSPVALSTGGIPGSAPLGQIAVAPSGCTGNPNVAAAAAVIASDTSAGTGYLAFITVPPVNSSPSPAPSPAVINGGNVANELATSVAFDSTCTAYIGTGYFGGPTEQVVSVPIGGTLGAGTPVIGSGPLSTYGSVASLVVNGGKLYAADSSGTVAQYTIGSPPAVSTGLALKATALASYGASGFVASFPNPIFSHPPGIQWGSYPGTGAFAFDHSMSSTNTDSIENLAPDGTGNYWGPVQASNQTYEINPVTTSYNPQITSSHAAWAAFEPNVPTSLFVTYDTLNELVVYNTSSALSGQTPFIFATFPSGAQPKGFAIGP